MLVCVADNAKRASGLFDHLARNFDDFLNRAKDVTRWVKNERLEFSITYYQHRRPRQYFPDVVVEALAPDATRRFSSQKRRARIARIRR